MDIPASKLVVFRAEKQPDKMMTIYGGPAGTLGQNEVMTNVPPSNASRVITRLYREYHEALFGSAEFASQVGKLRQIAINRIRTLTVPFLAPSVVVLSGYGKVPLSVCAPKQAKCWHANYLTPWLKSESSQAFFGVTSDGFFTPNPFTDSLLPFEQVALEDLLVFLSLLETFNFSEGVVTNEAVQNAV